MKKKPAQLIDRLIPISDFNKGQASKIFTRLQIDKSLIIVKNNLPIGILLSVDEYRSLTTKSDDDQKLKLSAENTGQ